MSTALSSSICIKEGSSAASVDSSSMLGLAGGGLREAYDKIDSIFIVKLMTQFLP